MRGELESVCQTVTANKSEAQIESTNDNQKKAPVRWYVWKITSYLSIWTRRDACYSNNNVEDGLRVDMCLAQYQHPKLQ